METSVRINKYLSDAGVCSRRDVDDLILSGRVEVNGELARIGMQLIASRDKVTVDGVLVDPEHPDRNAIDPDYGVEEEKTPWWEERRQRREAEEERQLSNPKSKLLRQGRKQAPKRESSKLSAKAKKASAKKKAATKTAKTSSTASRKGLLVKEAPNAALLAEKAEKRAAMKKGRTFGEALSDKQMLMNVKTRKIEHAVNPKAASLRGKKSAPARRRKR